MLTLIHELTGRKVLTLKRRERSQIGQHLSRYRHQLARKQHRAKTFVIGRVMPLVKPLLDILSLLQLGCLLSSSNGLRPAGAHMRLTMPTFRQPNASAPLHRLLSQSGLSRTKRYIPCADVVMSCLAEKTDTDHPKMLGDIRRNKGDHVLSSEPLNFRSTMIVSQTVHREKPGLGAGRLASQRPDRVLANGDCCL